MTSRRDFLLLPAVAAIASGFASIPDGIIPGDQVRIVAGPLRGVVGRYFGYEDGRAIVRFTLLGKSVRGGIDPDWIKEVVPQRACA